MVYNHLVRFLCSLYWWYDIHTYVCSCILFSVNAVAFFKLWILLLAYSQLYLVTSLKDLQQLPLWPYSMCIQLKVPYEHFNVQYISEVLDYCWVLSWILLLVGIGNPWNSIKTICFLDRISQVNATLHLSSIVLTYVHD